eukprot:m.778468 g.778468  ORF g.778468 m.778468 type:complete len:52 (+) comp23270_c0_seq46:604-759(+)
MGQKDYRECHHLSLLRMPQLNAHSQRQTAGSTMLSSGGKKTRIQCQEMRPQ